MTAVLTVMSGLDPHSIRITLGWLVNWDDVWYRWTPVLYLHGLAVWWLQVDSCVVLAWICSTMVCLLHGLAV